MAVNVLADATIKMGLNYNENGSEIASLNAQLPLSAD